MIDRTVALLVINIIITGKVNKLTSVQDKYDISRVFEDLKEAVKRIYNVNENQLLETSNAES